MPDSDTPQAFSRGEAITCFLVAALLDVVTGLRIAPGVLQGDLLNPDSFMRLARLGDILRAEAPLHAVLRDGSGDGTLLHWSHLLDSLLLLLALPLRPFLDWDAALHGAALMLGPVGMGLLGAAVAWAAAPLADRGWRWMAPVLVALALPIANYGLPGVVHHHVLLALVAVMLAGAAGRVAAGRVAAGWMLGAWAAGGIWLSPEAMPFVVLGFGGVGLAWMLRPEVRAIGAGFALGGSVFVVLAGLALAVDPPEGGIGSPAVDGISVVFVLLAAVLCGLGWALVGLDRARLSVFRRGVLGAGIGVAGLGVWLALFPVLLRGADALTDTQEAATMFADIEEMRPVTSLVKVLEFLLDGAAAVVFLGWLAVRDRAVAWRSALWAYATLGVLGLVVLGQQHLRFATYGTTAAAVLLPVALSECTRLLSARGPGVQAASRIAILAMVVLANRAEVVPGMFAAAEPAEEAAGQSCAVRGLEAMLAPYAGQVVLSDVNDVPELLYRTRIVTVGSLYRNVTGFSRLRAAWRSLPSAGEPAELRAARVGFVLFCKRPGRSLLVADLPEDTLLDRLGRGEVPAWLRPVARDAASGFTLYKVVDPA